MRETDGLLVAILLVVAGALATIVLLGTPVHATDIYIGDNWVINTDEEYSGDNITVRGHVNIKDGGSLTLRNSSLIMDSRRGDRFRLTVESTGNMYAYDSVIKNRFTNNNDERYFFDVWNDTILINTVVQRLYGWNGDNPGGLRLLDGSHIIVGCTIQDSRTWGIYTRCPLILKETLIRWTGWSRLGIYTNGRLFDMDFYIQNNTFVGNVNDPYSYGIYLNDGYTGQYSRYLNISHNNFEGLSYGIYSYLQWQRASSYITYNDFDRNSYGIRIWVLFMDTYIHHNHYSVRPGGIGIRINQGSYGNITWRQEDIRGSSLGDGTGVYLEGAGSGSHLVKDISIWNTYYGIVSLFGYTEVRDSYINTTNNAFYVYNGAIIEIFTSTHPIGSAFVDTTGGQVIAWQRLNISSVRWSDGTEISSGEVLLLNGTDKFVGSINLSLGQTHLDFKRWESMRSYIWVNEEVYPAILDRDTYFRAEALDILVTTPQVITFTDDYVPRLTVIDLAPGSIVNVSYVIMEGSVIERGRGLTGVEVRLDGGQWSAASVTDETWNFAYSFLADGVYDIHVRALDRAGNIGLLELDEIVVDTEPPMILLSEPVPQATNEPILHIEGLTERGATVFLGPLIIDPDDEGGFVIDFPLDEGTNGLILKAQDGAGNWNQSVMSIVLDTTPPELTILTPEDGMITNDPLVYVSGKVDEEVTVTIDGVAVSTFRGGFSKDLSLEEGTHQLLIEATDPAGNIQAALVTVMVDVTPPILVIEKPSSSDFTTIDATAFIAGRMDADLDYIFINGENRSALPGEFALQVDLVEGENIFTLVALDRAGNENRHIITITRDTRAPKYTVEDVTVLDGTITQSGSDFYASGETLVIHVRVDELSTFSIGSASESGTGQFSFQYTIQEGSNSITIEVEDPMGNLADPYHYAVIYDPEPPTVVVTSPLDGYITHLGEVVLKGVIDDGRSQVWVNDVPAGVRDDGSWELTVALSWGENDFTVRGRDRAGNEASVTHGIERKEKAEVTESNAGSYILGIVIGLVIGVVAMYVMSARGGKGPEEPPAPKRDLPPPPPPEEKGPGGSWEEY
jgi:hypothetical protein